MKTLELNQMENLQGGLNIDWYGTVCGALSGAWFLSDDVDIIEAAMVGYGCIS